MEDADRSLLSILAAVDAAFLPERPTERVWDVRAGPLRADYRSGLGIPWSSGGAANRMAASRALEALEEAGHVVRRAEAGRTTHVRLTDAGEARARSLVGLPSLLDAVRQGRKFKKYVDPDRWLIEVIPAGLECEDWPKDRGTDDPLMNLEERMLPLLLRGWAKSIEDAHRHAYYAITQRGAKALAEKLPPAPPDLYDQRAMEFYFDELGSAIKALKARKPELRLVQICRSCSECYYDPKEHGRKGRTWPRDLDLDAEDENADNGTAATP